MAISRRSGRSRSTLAILVLTSVTIITIDFRGDGSGIISGVRSAAREVFAPIQSAADAVVSPIGDVIGGIVHYGDLEAENDRLRDQLEAARGEALQAQDAARARDELLDLYDLAAVEDIPSIAARVISTDPSNFDVTVVLDRGSDDGVATGMPVVAGGGLVGRVIETSPSRSVVLLMTDPTFNVGVRFTKRGDVAVARGEGRGKSLVVDLVEVRTPVHVGDLVVTSGLQQSVFPSGIRVGTVLHTEVEPAGLQRDVELEPTVDLDRLEFVRVLQWSPEAGG